MGSRVVLKSLSSDVTQKDGEGGVAADIGFRGEGEGREEGGERAEKRKPGTPVS